jgi:hypothetical protein
MFRLRLLAHRCAASATSAAVVSWWTTFGLVYTSFGLLFSAVAFVLTTLFACACLILGGQQSLPVRAHAPPAAADQR